MASICKAENVPSENELVRNEINLQQQPQQLFHRTFNKHINNSLPHLDTLPLYLLN